MKKIICPLCNKDFKDQQDIVQHFKKEHNHIEEINLGGKKINLREE